MEQWRILHILFSLFVAVVGLAVLCNLCLLCLIKGMVGQSFPLTGAADITPIVSALTKRWNGPEPHLSIVSDIPCLVSETARGSWPVYFCRSVLVLWLLFVEAVIFIQMFCPHCDNHLSVCLKAVVPSNVLSFLEVKVRTEYHAPRLNNKILL